MIVEQFAFWLCKQWQAEASLQTKSANSAQKSVPPVPKSVKNIHTWSIAKSALKPVANALLSAAIWAKCNHNKKPPPAKCCGGGFLFSNN